MSAQKRANKSVEMAEERGDPSWDKVTAAVNAKPELPPLDVTPFEKSAAMGVPNAIIRPYVEKLLSRECQLLEALHKNQILFAEAAYWQERAWKAEKELPKIPQVDKTAPVVVTQLVGEPMSPRLSDDQLRMICSGLLNPSQGLSKSMARELRVLRGDPNPDAV